jgi:formate dehydrogenase subunit delta
MDSQKLVLMANQIAQAFRLKPDPAKLVAEHLKAFWSPVMCRELVAFVDSGGPGLESAVTQAAKILKSSGGIAQSS